VGDALTASQLGAAFTMNPGQTSDPVPAGSNYVVFRVLSRTSPDDSTFAQQQDQLREQLLDEKRNLAFEIYRKNLKEAMIRSGDLKMNDANMKQFVSAYTRS
jgi:parvulin-like peptidyl-prolyl isomerase